MTEHAPFDPRLSLATGLGAVEKPAVRAKPVWDQLARILLFCLTIIAALTFRDYGISTDEEVQHIYGQKLLHFYSSGFQDWSAFSFKDLYLYGGLFDLAVALLVPVSPFEEYDTRHLLCAIVGVIGIAGTWRLGRLLAGARAGFLAAVMLALSGVYYGAMFNNTKDVPFAAAMVWTVYFATRMALQFPKPRPSAVLKFGLALGLALGIRVGAILAGVYLGGAAVLYVALTGRRAGWRAALADARSIALRSLPGLPVAYGLMAALWPWGAFEPLNPFRALFTFSNFQHLQFSLQTLFLGEMVSAMDAPVLYLPVYLLIKLPETVVAGAGVAVLMGGAWAWRTAREGAAWDPVVRHAITTLAAFLPVLMFVAMRPTVYNGIRHFLFVVPPLVVLAAIAFDRLWSAAESRGEVAGQAVALALAATATVQAWSLGTLHPNQYVYYNQFVGGMKGAAGRFELDYWGNSLHEATKELIAFVERENDGGTPPRTYTLTVCGNPLAVRYDLPPWLKLVNGVEPDWRRADFFLAFTQSRRCPGLLDGRPIIEIGVDGVPLSIVKDRRRVEE
ncbi:glycosyltransferase family 39 protein [Azospirillum sp. sgz302134]